MLFYRVGVSGAEGASDDDVEMLRAAMAIKQGQLEAARQRYDDGFFEPQDTQASCQNAINDFKAAWSSYRSCLLFGDTLFEIDSMRRSAENRIYAADNYLTSHPCPYEDPCCPP